MSSFKGDSYYEAHVDDHVDPEYRESFEEDCAESEVPCNMYRDRASWMIANREALIEMFGDFKERGRAVFGNAFFQLGDLNQFCYFVYKYTTPGATLI